MPTAVITMGTMIGEISTAMIRPLKGNCVRVKPNAATVPSRVARAAAEKPTMMLLTIERCHRIDIGLSPKISLYQRSE